MSTFEVPIVQVSRVENHPNADRLSLVYFRDFITISAKTEYGDHRYNKGDLVVYVPENAIVPDYLLKKGFWNEEKGKGILAGTNGNRVKPLKLRGILSEGIMFPVSFVLEDFHEIWNDTTNLKVKVGDNVAEFLGITKYEPVIPASMSGEVTSEASDLTMKYDVENIKKYPDVLVEGEEVVYTEKIHGSNFQLIVNHEPFSSEVFCDGHVAVTSKGLGASGLVFKNNAANDTNIFVRASRAYSESLEKVLEYAKTHKYRINVFAEIFGAGVQDLTYGGKNIDIRVFDVYVKPVVGQGYWLNFSEVVYFCNSFGLSSVPVVHIGPFSMEKAKELSEGTTLVSNVQQIREGVVIKPVQERKHDEIGRIMLKYVGEPYLTRKGNTTEYN